MISFDCKNNWKRKKLTGTTIVFCYFIVNLVLENHRQSSTFLMFWKLCSYECLERTLSSDIVHHTTFDAVQRLGD